MLRTISKVKDSKDKVLNLLQRLYLNHYFCTMKHVHIHPSSELKGPHELIFVMYILE